MATIVASASETNELGDLLTGLSRRSLATHPLTVEYLEAGAQVVAEALDHDPLNAELHPFLSFLSRGEIQRAVNRRGNLKGSEGTIADRWTPHTTYIRDLIAWMRHRRGNRSFPARAAEFISTALASAPSPSAVVRTISEANQGQLFANPLFRLQLLAAAVLGAPQARASAPDIYDEIDERWTPFFETFLTRYGLTLRPGVSVQDLVEVLVAVGEGLALRELAAPSDGEDRQRRLRLQGTATLALLSAFVAKPGDSDTVDQTVDSLLA
jgi:hypothetical protein